MSPALILPAALAALLALAIPVVIHIARRTESRTIDFAALRWLDAAPKPRRSLRIDERLLLASRLLLLALIALWLAAPVLWNAADRRPVVAVAPGADAQTIAAATEAGDRVVWLAPGFPETGGMAPAASGDLVSLIRQLDAELPSGAPVKLVVPATLEGIDAERPKLSRRVEWAVGAEAPGRPIASPAPPALTVRYAPEAEDAVRYFRAAATAWTVAEVDPDFAAEPIDRPVPNGAGHLVWLAAGPVPAPVEAWVRNGGVILTALEARIPVEGETVPVWRGTAGEPLAVAGRLGRGRVIRLTRALEPAAIPQLVEPGFPDALATMLAPRPAPARVAAVDHPPLTGAAPFDQPALDLRPWLALLIALTFAVERWLATRRTRAVAP
ncbi:BatA domain-containing protein [Brevundimonas sp.]|uniref:BatA domain-containing protein n=1 Tax=Brevundimonas sp. TaxID=1871086 RepID=UPI00262FA3D4|nr:BatA domain-containing protein [Brevundimonas sp.]